MKHTRLASTAIASLVVGGLFAAGPATAAPPGPPPHAGAPIGAGTGPGARELLRYAEDTWTSMAAMAHTDTGLPDDNIGGDLDAATASGYTSPTNIGGYLWSTVTARDLGIIGADEARERLTATVSTLERMERNDGSGMYYNWYAPDTGAKLEIFPTSGEVIHPFLSTVDNGWLAAALRIVREAEPTLADRADALYESMDFSAFFDPAGAPGLPSGTNRGGFWEEPPGDGCAVEAPMYNGSGAQAFYTCHHYDTTVSESRIATYLHRAGRHPGDGPLRHAPHDAGRVRLGVAGAAADGADPHLRRRRRVRGRLFLRRHVVRAELGWQHVRVAHARPPRARDRVGSALVGAQPPDHGRGPEAARPR
ncbi:DUF3131 domain-containing protein [Rhodococcus sp. IEGM 1404]|nr:DUF3131 domain-containing protein [Microbacterium sp. IEGM 1404]